MLRQRLHPAGPSPAPEEVEGRAAKALSAQRGRAPIASAPAAGKAVAALMRPLLPQGGMGLSELKRRWPEIVGAHYSDKATPVKLTAGVLVVSAPGALAPFLQQQGPLLIERLRLAGASVKSIRIEHRTAPAKRPNVRPLKRNLTEAEEAALAHSLDRVDDNALKSALLRLGRAVKQG
ncbi:MAG: DciA family protein [Hyphomonadaceae bacterium]|nr:DciA family protein [Hyphomonadaceae bacterium]